MRYIRVQRRSAKEGGGGVTREISHTCDLLCWEEAVCVLVGRMAPVFVFAFVLYPPYPPTHLPPT